MKGRLRDMLPQTSQPLLGVTTTAIFVAQHFPTGLVYVSRVLGATSLVLETNQTKTVSH